MKTVAHVLLALLALFSATALAGDDCGLDEVIRRMVDPFHELRYVPPEADRQYVRLRDIRAAIIKRTFVGRDGRTYQIRTRRGRTTLFDDGVANGLLNIRVVDVETKFEAATLKLDVQGGQITIDRADAHGVGEGQGLIVEVLRRIREASPRGTRIHLASAEKKTNLVLDRIMADIVNSETYRNLLPEKQDPWNPPQGGLAEKFLFEEFNRRANIEEAGRLPKWMQILRSAGWNGFIVAPLLREGHVVTYEIQSQN